MELGSSPVSMSERASDDEYRGLLRCDGSQYLEELLDPRNEARPFSSAWATFWSSRNQVDVLAIGDRAELYTCVFDSVQADWILGVSSAVVWYGLGWAVH